MRFHTVAALYVLIFARFFHFSRGEWVLLLLTISTVLAAEAINTSIETLCDRVCRERDEHIKHTKDAVAGAVLVLAIFASVIGVILFSDPAGWQEAYAFYLTHPVHLTGLILLTILSPIYIFLLFRRRSPQKHPSKKNPHP